MGFEKNSDVNYEPSEPKPCANNCGFWGRKDTLNLCSKCYKDHQQLLANPSSEKSSNTLKLDTTHVKEHLVGSSSSSKIEHHAIDEKRAISKVVNRCQGCNKKVGLTGFKCKCGLMFCGNHRYPELHDCSFDFKNTAKDVIAKANPFIIAPKHNKI